MANAEAGKEAPLNQDIQTINGFSIQISKPNSFAETYYSIEKDGSGREIIEVQLGDDGNYMVLWPSAQPFDEFLREVETTLSALESNPKITPYASWPVDSPPYYSVYSSEGNLDKPLQRPITPEDFNQKFPGRLGQDINMIYIYTRVAGFVFVTPGRETFQEVGIEATFLAPVELGSFIKNSILTPVPEVLLDRLLTIVGTKAASAPPPVSQLTP